MVEVDLNKEKEKNRKAIEHLKRLGYTSNEHQKKLDKAYRELAEKRGYILNRSIETEMVLGVFLRTFYTFESNKLISPKENNFDFILENLSFAKKIELFAKIGYHLKDEFEKRYIGLEKILDKVRESRNLIAHSMQSHFIKPKIAHRKGEVELDDEFIKNFDKNADISMCLLNELNSKIIEERIDLNNELSLDDIFQ